jgi:hypothetical protein
MGRWRAGVRAAETVCPGRPFGVKINRWSPGDQVTRARRRFEELVGGHPNEPSVRVHLAASNTALGRPTPPSRKTHEFVLQHDGTGRDNRRRAVPSRVMRS